MPLERPTPEQIAAFIDRHGLTHKAFADLLGVSDKTVASWLHERRSPPPMLTRALRDIKRDIKIELKK